MKSSNGMSVPEHVSKRVCEKNTTHILQSIHRKANGIRGRLQSSVDNR
jgi:hypothetical protein